MIRIVLYVVMVAALVGGAVWLANDPGGATLTWRGWRIDTSVAVLVVAVVVFMAILGAAMKLFAWIRGSLRAYAAQQREKRMRKGLVMLGDGFAAVHAGHAATARRLARDAGSLLGDTPAVTVLRKQAAALDGDAVELKAAAETLLERPETEMAALRSLATRAQSDGDAIGAATARRGRCICCWITRSPPAGGPMRCRSSKARRDGRCLQRPTRNACGRACAFTSRKLSWPTGKPSPRRAARSVRWRKAAVWRPSPCMPRR